MPAANVIIGIGPSGWATLARLEDLISCCWASGGECEGRVLQDPKVPSMIYIAKNAEDVRGVVGDCDPKSVLSLNPLLGHLFGDSKESQERALRSADLRIARIDDHVLKMMNSYDARSLDYNVSELLDNGKARLLEEAIDAALLTNGPQQSQIRIEFIGASCDVLCEASIEAMIECVGSYLDERYGQRNPSIRLSFFDPEVFFDVFAGRYVRSVLKKRASGVLESICIHQASNDSGYAINHLQRVAIRRVGFTNTAGRRLSSVEAYCDALACDLFAEWLKAYELDESEQTHLGFITGTSLLYYPKNTIRRYVCLHILRKEVAWWHEPDELWAAGGWSDYAFGSNDLPSFYCAWCDCVSKDDNSFVWERIHAHVGAQETVRALGDTIASEWVEALQATADEWIKSEQWKVLCPGFADTWSREQGLKKDVPIAIDAREAKVLMPWIWLCIPQRIKELHPVVQRAVAYCCADCLAYEITRIENVTSEQGRSIGLFGKDKQKALRACLVASLLQGARDAVVGLCTFYEQLAYAAMALDMRLCEELNELEALFERRKGSPIITLGAAPHQLRSQAAACQRSTVDAVAQSVAWQAVLDRAVEWTQRPWQADGAIEDLLMDILLRPIEALEGLCLDNVMDAACYENGEDLSYQMSQCGIWEEALGAALPLIGHVAEDAIHPTLLVSVGANVPTSLNASVNILHCASLPSYVAILQRTVDVQPSNGED